MLDHLHFRRQFLLANEIPDGLGKWQHFEVGDHHLLAHPDLEVTRKQGPFSSIFLLGYLFDPGHPGKSNEEILSDILSKVGNLGELFHALKPYAGRYALLYRDANDFAILNDPLGLREIYYCTGKNRVICGSQPNTVDSLSEPKLGMTGNQEILDFYKHDLKLVRSGRAWVGDETCYAFVKHLMPNHYLDIHSLIAKRYWPNRRLEKLDLSQAVHLSCEYLKGVLKAASTRYSLMMAVTSGVDSRSLFAASREIQDKIYYFINQEPPMNENSSDIRVPKSMFERMKIPFHIHPVSGPVDEGFRKVFLDNTFMSTDRILPTIYNVYYKNHQDKVNLLGVGELGREYYGDAPQDLTGYYLAQKLKYRNSRYATAQCERWLSEVRDVANTCNVNVMKLFLWEGLLGNWGAVGNSESDIAIEEFDPYASHYIYEIMLSADQDEGKNGIGELFEGMFREMWPELLDYPFNPPDTYRNHVIHWLQKFGVYKYLQKGRYRFDRWRYQQSVGGPGKIRVPAV